MNSKVAIDILYRMFISNVFFISIFVPVHLVVLLILFTVLNYKVAWFHIMHIKDKLLLDLPITLNKL